MRAAGDAELKLYGIFGYPLGHTASPTIQNTAFDAYELKSLYFAFERTPAQFQTLMRSLKSVILDGFNVTVPYKKTVIPYLSSLSTEARAIGSVNTVKRSGKRWIGHNTDLEGFLAGLRQRNFSPRGKSVVVLGAGGSARTVVYALAKKGAQEIYIANRTQTRSRELLRNMLRNNSRDKRKIKMTAGGLRGKEFDRAITGADLIVNATKVGLKPNDKSLVPKRLFPKKRILVYDLIYRPRQTRLLKSARACGHRTLNGETMLLYQGARAFEIWTGKRAPIHQMKKVLRDALGR